MAVTGISHNQFTQILARFWSDADYKARMMDDPNAALAEMGVQVPNDRTVVVAESDGAFSYREAGDTTHVNLPFSPGELELWDKALDNIAAGFADESTDMPKCFLTTAIVRRRGEADDGPTLTALSMLRDNYLMPDPVRAMLVTEYYRDASHIAASIPDNHNDWERVAARVDAAAAAAKAGDNRRAFDIHAEMFRRIQQFWI